MTTTEAARPGVRPPGTRRLRIGQRKPGMSSSRTRSEYRPDIDGIRGAAAIMVMGFHARVPGFEGAYIGLDLFFVVSGYVICGLLLHEFDRDGRIRWGTFYARRARRLIPAKATMLLGVLVLSYFLLTPTGSQQQTTRSAAAAASFVSNVFFWRASDVDYFGHQPGTGVLLHTWSLSVEEQFYLAVPLALLLAALAARLLRVPVLRAVLVTVVVLGTASLLLAVAWAGPHPRAAYYLPMARAFEFLMGVTLALVVRRVQLSHAPRAVLGLVGAGLCAAVLWRPMPVETYPSWWALIPCTGALLMVWAGVGGPTPISRLLSLRLLVGLGLVSYGWYLWHWPILVMGEAVNLAPPPLWGRVLLVLVALGVAYLSYRYVEGLFYQRSGRTASAARTWGPPRVILTGVATMSTVVALALGATALSESQAASARWQGVAAQLADHPAMPADCLDGSIIPDRPKQCDLVPFEPGRPTVMLWGDSHAWMLIPALEAAAADRDVNLVAFVQGSCPPFVPPDDSGISCSKLNRKAMEFAERQSDRGAPFRVVLGASWETYRGTPYVGLLQQRAPAVGNVDYVRSIADLSRAGTSTVFERLASLGVPVDVVGPTPVMSRSAPLCVARHRLFGCDVARDEALVDEADNAAWLHEQMAGLAALGEPGGSRYVDVSEALCDDATCYAERDGVVVYFDDNHVSATMSRRLEPYFEATFRGLAG